MKVSTTQHAEDAGNSVAGSLAFEKKKVRPGNLAMQGIAAFSPPDARGSALQRMADSQSGKRAVVRPTAPTNGGPTRLPAVPVLKQIQPDPFIMQLAPGGAANIVVQQVTNKGSKKASKKAKKPAPIAQTGRYPGHDSDPNKRALYDVITHREKLKNIRLSHPEKTASGNSAPGNIQTGQQNQTSLMPQGTAICHKLSDKSIREEIEELLKNEKITKDPTALDNRMKELVDYIDHNKHGGMDMVPTGGDYENESVKKHTAAENARQTMINKKPGSFIRLSYAHIVGKNVANSPVNLFIGDSITNSTIQTRLDQNVLYKPKKLKFKKPKKVMSAKKASLAAKKIAGTASVASSKKPKIKYEPQITPRSNRAEPLVGSKYSALIGPTGDPIRSSQV